MSVIVQPTPASDALAVYNPTHLLNGVMHACGSAADVTFDTAELIWMAAAGYLIGANVVGRRAAAGSNPVKLGPIYLA